MRKKKLQRRVKQLYRLELFNVLWLPAIYYFLSLITSESVGPNSVITIILNSIMLVEGSFIWFNIYKKLSDDPHINFVNYFNKLRLVNIVLIVLTFISILSIPFNSSLDKIGTYCFFSLALLEFINYFELQLMYDNVSDLKFLIRYKKLKTSKYKRYANTFKDLKIINTTAKNAEHL